MEHKVKEKSKTRLIELRGERTQDYIAKQVGLTQQSYRNYESGERQANYETLVKLANYFGVSIDYILMCKNPNLSENRQKLLDKVQTLSEEQVAVLLSVANSLK